MADTQSNNKRIAKNTVMLYVRMLLSIVVSLYTSRVVLQTLGVEDYGIYGLVGGIITMFSFLNSSMSGATSRFLTFEMGKEDEKRLRDTFSTALIVHIGIALLVLVLAETVGLWFLYNKLVIPEDRMTAAIIVYQCSIISMLFSVTQVPYNATIIAHEQMDVYAYVELLHVFLKLGIVYILLLGNYDKLIIYAILVLVVSVVIAMIYRVYCLKHYQESHFRWIWDKGILRPMLSFSGWDLLGHFGFAFRTQGTNMVINMFFGAAVNAAGGLAGTVQSILYGFSGNVITAIKPQIIKQYSIGNLSRMTELVYSGVKISLFLILVMSIPIITMADFVFTVWLKDVPQYCVSFCIILLVSNVISTISQIIYTGIQATGDLRLTSIIRNIIYVGTPFCIYLYLSSLSGSPNSAYIAIVLSQLFLAMSDIFILTNKINAIKRTSLFRIVLNSAICSAISLLCCYGTIDLIANSYIRFISVVLISVVSLSSTFALIVLTSTERHLIFSLLRKKFKHA